MKVSFDFDNTLSKNEVQDFAKSLISKNIEVWIVTARYDDDNYFKVWYRNGSNSTLYEVVDRLGISRDKIVFMNMESKSNFLNNKGFIWHLDDDYIELNELRPTDVVGVDVLKNDYKIICKKMLDIK